MVEKALEKNNVRGVIPVSEKISYSVAIRTLGTAGEKYEKLLNSIQKQTIRPEKIAVVLPNGYKLPEYQLGCEEFVFSQKGMIPQRLEAIKYISSDYILFCDDDVELEENFVDKLSDAFAKGYSCATGPLLEFFPPDSLRYKIASLLGGACVMLHGRKKNYVRLLRTGGWSYNHSIDINNHKIYNSESVAGTCFMSKTQIMKNLNLEDEFWAERNGYSAFEDRIMIGKMVKNRYKVGVVSDAKYYHNDGKTSVSALKLEPHYAGAFNHYVFWHRYIYSLSRTYLEKIWAVICINYYILMSLIYGFVLCKTGRSSNEIRQITIKGFRDAKKYVKSDEYNSLAPVIQTR